MSPGTVCLSFDFDAVSLWLARGVTAPGPVSRGEFAAVAVPRVLELLDSRGLRCSWFIPGHTVETYPEVCREVVGAGHEVGLHGYAHESSFASVQEERAVLERSWGVVADLCGLSPRGFRAPGGNLGPRTVELLLDQGIAYDSSLKGSDAPYWCRQGDELPPDGLARFGDQTRLVEVPTNPACDDFWCFEFYPDAQLQGLRSASAVLENWLADIDAAVREHRSAVFVLHPEVSGRGHRLLMLEQLIDASLAAGHEFGTLAGIAERFADTQARVIDEPAHI